MKRRRGISAVYLCASVFICGFPLSCSSAEEKAFEPAFGPEQIDFAQTKQFVGDVAAEADPERVQKALGFYAAGGNWEQKKWDLGKTTQAGTTVFQYLLVLKQPVEVGSMCACPADLGSYKGSQNNGEVWYLKAGAAVPQGKSPADDAQWIKVEFGPGQPPGMRFFVFPPGTRTQAFVYKDIRVAGQSAIDYWRFYKRRLCNLAPAATGYSCAGGDPETVPNGLSWEVKQADAKTPAWYILAWDTPQPLSGVFLYSSVTKYQFFAYTGGAKGNPAIAPETDWEPLKPAIEEDNTHSFPQYKYYYRWLGLGGAPTRALKLQVLSSDGRAWVSGFGAFADLKQQAPPAPAKREVGPPFRIPVTWPETGEAAMAFDTKDGRRVRNLKAQAEVRSGADECAWDLKDDTGNYVPAGTYVFKAICAPPLQLHYQMTPCPNIDQFWPDRVPWLTSHDGASGWLSDHCQNWAVATRGDRLYFGAPMAEAGVCLIECDLDGKKLWGKHDFGAWQGVNLMAADDEAVYVERNGTVFRMNAETRAAKELLSYNKNSERRGYLSAMAAYKGTLCLAFTGEQWLDNAVAAASVDLDRCIPKPPGGDLLRLLRLTSTPPGKDAQPKSDKPQGNGRLDLESAPPASGGKSAKAGDTELEPAVGERATQHAVIAFRQPVPLGSLVFPAPEDGVKVRFSILKPNAPYPPRPGEEVDWEALDSQSQPGWNCLPAPRNAMTRALRASFARATPAKGEWFGRLEGLKLLRRRFTGLNAKAKVRVNSGAVDATGAWDAKRTEAVGREKPGIYVMEWPQAEKLRGLAIKEVDGAVTEIDLWQGPVQGDVPLEGAALDRKSKENGWRNVATYTQKRRSAQYNDECNKFARYMDGCVDFNAEIETRAIRLRVVEQWLDNGPDNAECRKHDGRSEHGMHYTQSYAAKLDTRCCAILGVAPLQYVGGEPPVEPLVYERLEVYDGRTGKLTKEWPVKLGWHGLSFGPQGELYAIAKDHENILKVDAQTGEAKVVITGSEPHTMTAGTDGLIYVHPWSHNSTEPISVYSPDGKKVRTIGKPGGWKPGPWDPERLGPVHRLCVDRNQNLWVLETDNYPRRIVQFKTDGKFVKEIIGNTWYGGTGGGNLNRYDKSRAYYGRVEFELDWQQNKSRVRGLLADNLLGQDLVAVRVAGQKPTYLVTAPLSMNPRQSFGAVYIYDDQTGTVKLVAAVGDATSFQALRNSSVLSALQGAVPKAYTFTWSDRNANGLVDADEVAFEKKADIRKDGSVGRFDEQLGCTGEGVWYRVREFLADGTPVYERKPVPGAPHFRLSNGNLLTLYGSSAPNKPSEDFVTTPEGEKLWGYPAGGGVSGLSITPWQPGLVGNEFGIIGHETAPAGDLGEFVIIHANTGQWHIWTADGLLAGQVMLHKHDARARFFGPVPAPPGTRLDPLSVNQEHFHGFFTRAEQDNKYYAVAGFTHMSVIEVKGLERFRRVNAEVRVTDDDLAKVRAWEAVQLQRKIERRAMLIQAAHMAHSPAIDGKKVLTEWPATATLENNAQATFSIGYDDTNLYLCWTSKGMGALKNSGTDFHRYFKTGACVDFMLGADPAADPGRTKPAHGDLRLLLTYANGQPKAVLYQPLAPKAAPADAWKTFTQAGGETAFARVALLSDVKMAMSEDRDGYTLEASVPLATLGLQPKPGLRLKMDWGVLATSDGNQVKQRAYWANQLATGTSDEAIEARLEPHLWGYVGF